MKTDAPLITKNWQNAKHILIIPNTKANQDICFAALALLQYGKTTGKDISILHPGMAGSKIWKEQLPEKLLQAIHSAVPKRLAIDLGKDDLGLENVSMEKDKGSYRIILEGDLPDAGTITINPKLHTIRQKFDLVILIGPPTLNILLEHGWDRTGLEKQQILLFSNTKNREFPEFPKLQVYPAEEKGFSLKLYSWFHTFRKELDVETSTLLLSGLIAFSSNFTKNIQAALFTQAAELSQAGADYYQAYHLANQNLTLSKIVNIGGLLHKVEKLAEGVYLAIYPAKALGKMKLDPEDMLKHSEIYNCELAVVYLEGTAGTQTKAYFKARTPGSGLKHILKQLQGKGNSYDGMVLTDKPVDEFKRLLLEIMAVPGNKDEAHKSDEGSGDPLNRAGSYPKPLNIDELMQRRKVQA